MNPVKNPPALDPNWPTIDDPKACFKVSIPVLAYDGKTLHEARYWTGTEPKPWNEWRTMDGHIFHNVVAWMPMPEIN